MSTGRKTGLRGQNICHSIVVLDYIPTLQYPSPSLSRKMDTQWISLVREMSGLKFMLAGDRPLQCGMTNSRELEEFVFPANMEKLYMCSDVSPRKIRYSVIEVFQRCNELRQDAGEEAQIED
jgi:hypothetical protein